MKPTPTISVAEAASAYLEWCGAIRNLAPATISAYRYSIRTVLTDLLDTPINALNQERMERAVLNLATRITRRGSPATGWSRVQAMINVRRFCKWAVAHGHLRANPLADMRPPRRKRQAHDVLTPDDVAAITAQANPLSAAESRDAAITWSLYTGGCRIGEHVRLMLRDLDWAADDVATVYVRFPEKDGEHRRIRIYGRAAVSLRTYLAYHRPKLLGRHDDPGWLFLSERGTGPLHVSNYGRRLATWARSAGMPFGVHPHLFRHSCATNIINGGADIEDLRYYMGWRGYTTAIFNVHRNGRDTLARIARAQPALPVGHVEDRPGVRIEQRSKARRFTRLAKCRDTSSRIQNA